MTNNGPHLQEIPTNYKPRASESSADTPSTSLNIEHILQTLNSEQLKAVEHDPSVPLQILAGPGSGKTKVLISRIVQLIMSHKISPSSICAVTFTNKAANEMRERLIKIIGKMQTNSLQMGTFHSLCAKFLRMYSHKVDLKTNFTICDAEESKKLIAALLKPYKEYLSDNEIPLTEGRIASAISKAKAKGYSASTYAQEAMKSVENLSKGKTSLDPTVQEKKSMEQIIAEVYTGYEQILKQNNALDFDDLLIYGVKLFSQHRDSVLWCTHILVDEFQDTNTMQYELMKSIAIKRCITIVGDPDQSIYGWRSAEVINLSRMRKDFPDTHQIFLEQNYRSTAAILRSSLAIVSEDKNRIQKSLHTSNPLGFSPVIGEFESEKEEAAFIAFEIKRCVANMGGVLRWGDFVVLLRFNALSRPIESALQKEGIPCRILGGHKFFERMEVKDILSYLQLADNPDFDPAFIRAVKAPNRGIGDKTLAELASRAADLKVSQLKLIESIHDNKVPDIKPSIKRKITSFVQTIRILRKLDEENVVPSEIIRKLVKIVNYEDYLKKTQQDWESRWENIQELITFASEVESEVTTAATQYPPGHALNGTEKTPKGTDEESILRQFLQASMLSSEGDNQSEAEGKEKVTLATCHAAKGLEWPVVIIPSVDQDTFPFYRTEDIAEERRLLYVACTRAQSLLYLSHARQRQVAGKTKQKKLSDFVSVIHKKNEGHFSHDVPRFLPQDRSVISKVLGRALPDETEISKRLAELESSGVRLHSTFQRANGGFSAISLTGVKSSVGNEVAGSIQYAAPDVLATISASFMKDYKRPAFSNISDQSPRPTTFQASFMSASSVVQGQFKPSKAESSSSYIHHSEGKTSQIAESPQQGTSNRPMSTQSSRQLTIDQKWLSSIHYRASALTAENEACLTRAPRSDYTRPLHHTITAGSTSRSFTLIPDSTLEFGRQPSLSPSVNRNANGSHYKTTPSPEGTHFSQRKEKGHRSATTSTHGSERLVSETQISGQQSIASNDNRPRPPEDYTPRHVCSNGGQTTGVLSNKEVSVDYEMACIGGAGVSRTTEIPQNRVSRNIRAGVISGLEDAAPTLRQDIVSASDGSHAINQPVPQTAVKRRLGMGRTTTGYSNKKFKRPV